MQLVETLSKNNEGVQYEARIFESSGSHYIDYMKDGQVIKTHTYTDKPLVSIQREASQWLSSIGMLKG